MTNEDVERIAGRLYELATVKNLPPDSAKRHMTDVLRQILGVAYEEAAREVCEHCRQGHSSVRSAFGYSHPTSKVSVPPPALSYAMSDPCAASAVRALNDSLQVETAST